MESVTVAHRQGRFWRLLVLKRDAAALRLESAKSIPAESTTGLDAAVDEADSDLTIRILPAGSVICRTLSLPPMDDAILAASLDLQAEGVLPSGLDAHRRAAAPLPWSDTEHERTAVAVGWPGELPDDWSTRPQLRFAPPAACLIELLAAAGGVGVAGYVDRERRSIELVGHDGGPTVIRVTRLTGSDPASDARTVVEETALAGGVAPEHLAEVNALAAAIDSDSGHALLVSADARKRLASQIRGVQSSTEWWNEFGLALAAAVGAMGSRHAIFDLYPERPEEPTSPVVRALRWVEQPRRATMVIALAILLLFLAPRVAAWARNGVLVWKAGDREQVSQQYEEIQDLAAFYEMLADSRWPMTKLLADLSLAAPSGVQLDVVNIVHGQEIVIQGAAPLDAVDAVTTYWGVLENSGIFDKVYMPSYEPGENHIAFELRATVRNPYQPLDDYSVDPPRRVELWGERARDARSGYLATTTGRPARRMPGASRSPSRPETDRTPSRPDDAATPRVTQAELTDPGEIPDPLDDQELKTMSRTEITAAIRARTRHMYRQDVEQSVKTRLRDEFQLLVRRQMELNREEGDR
ncbi:MAG: hypothetical protein ACF8PN_02090 [Phycisphaerales bacterium]